MKPHTIKLRLREMKGFLKKQLDDFYKTGTADYKAYENCHISINLEVMKITSGFYKEQKGLRFGQQHVTLLDVEQYRKINPDCDWLVAMYCKVPRIEKI